MDFEQMTPREIVAGLMRGNREEQKLGYSAGSAVITAVRLKHLDDDDAADLLNYAEGFAAGLVESTERTMPASGLVLRPTAEEATCLEYEDA